MACPRHQKDTGQRLLNAAGELFAERGFHATSVREICDKAKTNVSSIRYHYGDKEALYEAAVFHAHAYADEKYPLAEAADPALDPEARLLAFVRAFLFRFLDPDRPLWHCQLLARETTLPGPALEALANKRVRGVLAVLAEIVARLLPEDADEGLRRRCAASVAGQCLFYPRSRHVLQYLSPDLHLDAETIETLARHITGFSLAALRSDALRSSRPVKEACL